MKISRRHFVKGALAAGTALALPHILVRRAQAAWVRKDKIHPNIDNFRVVGITDPAMIRPGEKSPTWADQEKLVNAQAVADNIDKLACTLAKTKSTREAWQAIFVKPAKKSWSDVVVAIKTNHIADQHTRSAVMAKVCHALTDEVGVKGENVHIYDACHGSSMTQSTPFTGLPPGCRMENQWGGYNKLTQVPAPWKGTGGQAACLDHLVDNTVDILVNVALCKGHSKTFGGFTMTMKNHFGTFDPRPSHAPDGGLNYLIALNQTPEIVGPMDPVTGAVLFPRQQLCIIDALWASQPGPGGYPTHQPNFLAMGVTSPVVDYVLATKFRKEQMGWDINQEAADRFLTDFGYTTKDLPEGGDIIKA